MSAKPWNDMNLDEKLEHLREDTVSKKQFDQLREYTHSLEDGLKALTKRVVDLEKNSAKPVDGGHF